MVAYRPYADGAAVGVEDHGTHVVGTIVGFSNVPNAAGSDDAGLAYGAKVSFTDIGPGDSPGLQVTTPREPPRPRGGGCVTRTD